MANRKVTMIHLRAIIREFHMGTPMREIERKLSISRTSLRPYKERAEASGMTMEELLRLEDADLYAILSRDDVHRNRDADSTLQTDTGGTFIPLLAQKSAAGQGKTSKTDYRYKELQNSHGQYAEPLQHGPGYAQAVYELHRIIVGKGNRPLLHYVFLR